MYRRFLTLAMIAASALEAQTTTGISLAVSTETVPPGGVAQVKVFITEPKPIVRSSMEALFDESYFGSYLGIAAAGGLTGVARPANGRLRVELSAAKTDIQSDYPILTIAVQTRPNLPEGASTPVSLDLGSSLWIDPLGQPYPEEAKAGSVTIGGTMYVSNVIPGGGTVKSGDTFRITGSGFANGIRADGEGVRLQSFTPTELTMVARQTVQLSGTRIRVQLNKEEQTYFSYLRAGKDNFSSDPALQGMLPVFSTNASVSAIAPLDSNAGIVNAVGLQNPNGKRIEVDLCILDVFLRPIRYTHVELDPRMETFRSTGEFFGASLPLGAYAVWAYSDDAFQMTAAQVDKATSAMRAPIVFSLKDAAY